MKAGKVVVGAAAAAAKSLRGRAKPQAVYVTAAARNRLQQLAAEHPGSSADEAAGDAASHAAATANVPAFKLGLRSRGCNGLAYTLDYHDGGAAKFEEVVEEEGVRLVIDSKALMFVIGTTMDFVETPTGSEFVFLNPNATGTCGCGESFSVGGSGGGDFEQELRTELEKLKAKKDQERIHDVD